MAWLLDTNILSELRKGKGCDRGVRSWAVAAARDRHFISVLSLGEIRKGIEVLRRRAPAQCPAFERWLDKLREEYADQVLQLDEAVLDEWGRLMAVKTLPPVDGLLAATARCHDLTVVTRNVADFRHSGVKVVDPFGG